MFEINLLNDVMNGMSLLYFVLNPKVTMRTFVHTLLYFLEWNLSQVKVSC